MAIRLPSSDVEFLEKVRDLGVSGMTQEEIAAACGVSLGSLRFRLARLGFELVPANNLRTTLGKRLLAELIQQGELIAGETERDREPVEVAA